MDGCTNDPCTSTLPSGHGEHIRQMGTGWLFQNALHDGLSCRRAWSLCDLVFFAFRESAVGIRSPILLTGLSFQSTIKQGILGTAKETTGMSIDEGKLCVLVSNMKNGGEDFVGRAQKGLSRGIVGFSILAG